MPTEIAIAVVEHNGWFLVGQRGPGAALAGYWEFPGGKVEPGESAAEAARRECLEETGVAVEIVKEYPPQREAYAHGELLLRFFAAHPIRSEVTPQNGFAWISREQLDGLQFPTGNRNLLQLLKS